MFQVVVEHTREDGKLQRRIQGAVKLSGQDFHIKCHCDNISDVIPSPTKYEISINCTQLKKLVSFFWQHQTNFPSICLSKRDTCLHDYHFIQCFHFNRTKKVCSSLREYKIIRLSSGISRNISSPVITNEDIRSVLPRSADLEFVQVQNTSINDVDHRQQGAILSGNGGDAVEFVLALQAFQFLTRSTLSESTVAKLFKNYLNHTRPRRFFLRTRSVDNSPLLSTVDRKSTDARLILSICDKIFSKDAIDHLNEEMGNFNSLDTPAAADQVLKKLIKFISHF